MGRLRRLTPYIGREWRRLAVIGLLTVLSSLSAALQPWPLKVLIDYALGGAAVPAALVDALARLSLAPSPAVFIVLAAGASLALFLLTSLLSAGLSWTWAVAGQRMIRRLATDVFARMQRLALVFHQRHTTGDLLSRLTSDTWSVYKVANEVMLEPVQRLSTFAAVGVIAWQLHPRLAAVSLLTAPLMAVAAFVFGRPLKRRARLGREARARLVSFVQQTLSAIPVVQAFGTEPHNRRRYLELADDAVTLSQRTTLLVGSYGLVTGLITAMGTAVIIYVGGREVLAGSLSLGSFVLFVSYLRTMQNNASAVIKLYGKLKPLEAGIDRVVEVLEAPPEVSEASEPTDLPDPTAGIEIRLDGVTFGYAPRRPVLQDVSFGARPGETVALVGPTGSGKSTTLSLMLRFFDPWEGRVTLGGVDIREARLEEVRSRIAVVLQEPFLFPGSVGDNIACGRPDAGRDAIVAAARAANLAKFIEQAPEGLDTLVGEAGAMLSGGERQRVSIARAILRDAPVLLLDEPTSALDPRTETHVVDALHRLMAGRTTVVVAHRLSTIRHADRIVVLDRGRVTESGSHDDLLERQGTYWRLHARQTQEVTAS